MNSHQVDCFLRVVKHMSFSKAASEMHISQPSLSKQVKKLETEYGVLLFDRSKRRPELTLYGEQLYDFLKEASEEYQLLRETAIVTSKVQTNALSIAFPLGSRLMDNFMQKLNEVQRGTSKYLFNMFFLGIGELYRALKDDTVDFVVSMEDLLPEDPQISSVPIMFMEKTLVYRRDMFPKDQQPTGLADFSAFPFLITHEVEEPDKPNSRYREENQFPFEPLFCYVPNIESIIWNVMRGDGVAILDRSIDYFMDTDESVGTLTLEHGHNIILAWRNDIDRPMRRQFIESFANMFIGEEDE